MNGHSSLNNSSWSETTSDDRLDQSCTECLSGYGQECDHLGHTSSPAASDRGQCNKTQVRLLGSQDDTA